MFIIYGRCMICIFCLLRLENIEKVFTNLFTLPYVSIFLLSLTHVMIEKVLFFGQIFKMEILMNLHVMRSPQSKNHIFSVSSVCMCVCYQHNSKTNCSRSIKFGILNLYHVQMLLETFCKDRTKTLCTGIYKRILIH